MRPLLSIQGITAGYGEISILENVSLELLPRVNICTARPKRRRKINHPKSLFRQLVPTKGELMVAGKVMTGSEPNALARAGICTIPEGKGIFPNLTVRENLLMMTSSGARIEEIEQATYNRFPQLSSRRKNN